MENKKRTGFQVMAGLIGMVKQLLGYMFLAVFMGCIGNLMATFLTILGGMGILTVMGKSDGLKLSAVFVLLIICGVFRGVLRYAEQACNHYIAFKLLARIRHQVFKALRKLTPAKLDGREKGNLISIITSDIELLEVFYAHTISPVAIAVITSVIMIIFIGMQHWTLGVFAAVCYVLTGALIPILNGRYGRKKGQDYRENFGKLNAVVLDNLYGIEEILQYDYRDKRRKQLDTRTTQMEETAWKLKRAENMQSIVCDGVILGAGVAAVVISVHLTSTGVIEWQQAFLAVVGLMSSFGPVAALGALSNNLNQTLASGDRVLSILEEKPVVEEITDTSYTCEGDIVCQNIGFSYSGSDKEIFSDFSNSFEINRIHGILGKSGCGKSTLLKLLMRFYQVPKGQILYGDTNVEKINTSNLRNAMAYVSQETFLFQDTIENNIKIARMDASREEVIDAAQKASVHDFIQSLPKGYDTRLSELGSNLSGGETQRIGLARAFLHNCKIIYLDEPTSNIDSLNEGIILKSLADEKAGKTIILVSHRKSTMGIADRIMAMQQM